MTIYFVICLNDMPVEVTTERGLADERAKQLQVQADVREVLSGPPHRKQYVWVCECPTAKLEK